MIASRTILFLAIVGLPLFARAASMPDQQRVDQGKALAQKQCSSCHVVDGQGGGSDAAPSFSSIATTRGDEFLHTWLIKPHGNMPPVDLTNEQTNSIIAYIESLKK